RNLVIQYILIIRHISSGAVHFQMVLDNGRIICDCGMFMNLGVPCRHYFRALRAIRDLWFHVSLIRARWYIDPEMDVDTVPFIMFNGTIQEGNRDIRLRLSRRQPTARGPPTSRGQVHALDEDSRDSQAPPSTQTISSRQVYHEVQAAIRPILSTVQTQDQLASLISALN
ncbi:hypothetical protein SCHPADRAFT_809234, partial [Schizopora paradoxa]